MSELNVKELSDREILMAFTNLRNGWEVYSDQFIEELRAEWRSRKSAQPQ